ncbi:hypothetical protein [Pontibacter sp. G13]|uniref:hypothetical protein n=1 Tax=Pontibacter sp. G13 TaxID=3074898 RepID=UPI00288C1601|nr:hypothetical protein [Pontibacter sp. G13]WNJ16757.1 hypothetical protein RJD25_17965 [Pontibacter sp. G13]
MKVINSTNEDLIKSLIATALGKVPGVGSILKGIFDILWTLESNTPTLSEELQALFEEVKAYIYVTERTDKAVQINEKMQHIGEYLKSYLDTPTQQDLISANITANDICDLAGVGISKADWKQLVQDPTKLTDARIYASLLPVISPLIPVHIHILSELVKTDSSYANQLASAIANYKTYFQNAYPTFVDYRESQITEDPKENYVQNETQWMSTIIDADTGKQLTLNANFSTGLNPFHQQFLSIQTYLVRKWTLAMNDYLIPYYFIDSLGEESGEVFAKDPMNEDGLDPKYKLDMQAIYPIDGFCIFFDALASTAPYNISVSSSIEAEAWTQFGTSDPMEKLVWFCANENGPLVGMQTVYNGFAFGYLNTSGFQTPPAIIYRGTEVGVTKLSEIDITCEDLRTCQDSGRVIPALNGMEVRWEDGEHTASADFVFNTPLKITIPIPKLYQLGLFNSNENGVWQHFAIGFPLSPEWYINQFGQNQ